VAGGEKIGRYSFLGAGKLAFVVVLFVVVVVVVVVVLVVVHTGNTCCPLMVPCFDLHPLNRSIQGIEDW